MGKIIVQYKHLQRQFVIGGVKCPNLSLKPDQNIRSVMTLEKNYTPKVNAYSFLDRGMQDIPTCEFFPKKFHQ